jgi:predicted nuclease of predicted toxin-antitoxin system
MKLLLDTCVWGGAKVDLVTAGYDVLWCGDWEQDPGDEEIMVLARREQRILITLDKDFGELAIVKGRPHSGIIRLVDIRAREQGKYCLPVLERYRRELRDGAIVTLQGSRIRIRPSVSPDSGSS